MTDDLTNLHEIRRANLRRLIQEADGPSELARRLGFKNASYLSHVAGPSASKPIGEHAARHIEGALGLPAGWLDQKTHLPANTEGMVTVVARLAHHAKALQVPLAPTQLTKLALLAHEHAVRCGDVDDDYLRQLILLLKD